MSEPLDDLRDLVIEHERGQVHHGGGAHAGADVGRAGGQVAVLGVPGPAQLALQRLVEGHRQLEVGVAAQPGADDLEPDVVLLVEHQRVDLVAADEHPGGVLAILASTAIADDLASARSAVAALVARGGSSAVTIVTKSGEVLTEYAAAGRMSVS